LLRPDSPQTLQALSAILFAVAGLVVKPERHRYLIGIRREDWFHLMIAAASVGIALRLSAANST
jgi:hypothetical protein